jgi:hypothetical protein
MNKQIGWVLGAFIGLVLLTGCTKSKTGLDTAALTPLVKARYTADSSVRSLKELYCDQSGKLVDGKLSESEQICRETRLRYNRAATSINTVLSQLTLSIESNVSVANDKVFKQEVERSITAAFDLERFLAESLARPSGLPKFALPFGLTGLVDTLLGAIPSFSAAARQADGPQRAFMVCELKGLKLQPFDTLDRPLESSNCAALLGK